MSWTPDIESASGPKYERIVRCIEQDVRRGVLRPGDQLPTQRALAGELGVTVGTVARAYTSAQRLGLIGGEVGRGTFITGRPESGDSVVDLSLTQPLDDSVRNLLIGRMREMEMSASDLFLYRRRGGERDREAGKRWLGLRGVDASADEIMVTSGGQNGIFLSLAVLCSAGETVLVESLTYPGVMEAASILGLRIEGLDLDEDDPGRALERAAKKSGAKVVFLIPVLHNPTTRTWNERQIRSLASAIERAGLTVIEDDVYGGLEPKAPKPLWTRAREAVFVTSLSKSLTAGLRVGYLAARGEVRDRLERALFASTLMISGINAELANELILDLDIERLLAGHRERIAERSRLARRILPAIDSDPHALHIWLSLSSSRWKADAFATECGREGIVVSPSGAFAAGDDPNDHVRISLGGGHSLDELQRALERVAAILERSPRTAAAVI